MAEAEDQLFEGKEAYRTLVKYDKGEFKRFYYYAYQHADGEVFVTSDYTTLAQCRRAKDRWLKTKQTE